MPDEEPDDASSGWDAITRALERLYPGQESAHFGTLLGFRIDGPDPLDGISAYRAGGFTEARLRVVPSQIRDAEGNVVQVIGE